MRGITRLSYNDMMAKGFDSSAQERWLWMMYESGEPCYWWVPEVYAKHGHATVPGPIGDGGPYTTWQGCGKGKASVQRSLTRFAQVVAKPVVVKTVLEPREFWVCPHCNKEIGEKELYCESPAIPKRDGFVTGPWSEKDSVWYHSRCKEAGPITLPKSNNTFGGF